MANVFDFASEELVKLQLLADELEGILLVIANDGKASDRKYIVDAKRIIAVKYGSLMKRLRVDEVCFPGDRRSGIGKALDCVRDAYHRFLEINLEKGWYDPRNVETEARDILYEYLIFSEEVIEEFVGGRKVKQES